MIKVFDAPSDLLGQEGLVLGPTEWLTIDQRRIDLFAEATGDDQWIHVDPARAAKGPFARTIAHGFLTLALVPQFLAQLLDVRGAKLGINMGADRLRFIHPVAVGCRLRARAELTRAEEVAGAVRVNLHVVIEIEGENGAPIEKPACVVDSIMRFYIG